MESALQADFQSFTAVYPSFQPTISGTDYAQLCFLVAWHSIVAVQYWKRWWWWWCAATAAATHQTMCMNNFHLCHEYSLKQYLTFPLRIHVYFHHFNSVLRRWGVEAKGGSEAEKDSLLTAFPWIVPAAVHSAFRLCFPVIWKAHTLLFILQEISSQTLLFSLYL